MAASWDEKFKPDCAKINYILGFLGDLNGGRVLDVGTGDRGPCAAAESGRVPDRRH